MGVSKRRLALAGLFLAAASVAGCVDDAKVVSQNLSKAADNFEVNRRVVFYNNMTGEYMLSIEGLCSLGSGSETRSLTVTCMTGPNEYKKHFLGLAQTSTYFVEQMEANKVSKYFYRVSFKPSVIIPDIRLQ